MKINIEHAQLTDLNELAILFNQYRTFYNQADDLPLARDFVEQRIKNKESVILFAKDNEGHYLGFTQLYPSFSSVSAKKTWILNDLFVEENSRGLGIGTQLLNVAATFATKTNSDGITLQTAITNTKAQKLYESLGYKQDTEYYCYFLCLDNKTIKNDMTKSPIQNTQHLI